MATTIPTPDGDLPVYVAGSPHDARAAVVVIQEAFGVTAHIERCADRLASDGFFAIAPSLFHRTTTESFAYDDFEHVMPHMGALTKEGIEVDLAAVTAHLADAGF